MQAVPDAQVEPIPLSVPGVRAIRRRSDAPYFGLKEVFSICRFESGRSEFWTHGRTWPGRPGSVVIHQPGDVHRDVSRDGPITYQVIALPPAVVDALRSGSIDLHTAPGEGVHFTLLLPLEAPLIAADPAVVLVQ